jgi:hypothetical protein
MRNNLRKSGWNLDVVLPGLEPMNDAWGASRIIRMIVFPM